MNNCIVERLNVPHPGHTVGSSRTRTATDFLSLFFNYLSQTLLFPLFIIKAVHVKLPGI